MKERNENKKKIDEIDKITTNHLKIKSGKRIQEVYVKVFCGVICTFKIEPVELNIKLGFRID